MRTRILILTVLLYFCMGVSTLTAKTESLEYAILFSHLIHLDEDRQRIDSVLARKYHTTNDIFINNEDETSIYTAYETYIPIAYIGEKSSTVYSPWSMYTQYVHYMIAIKDSYTIIPFEQYITNVEPWRKLIPEKYVYSMYNESLKQNVPMRYIYAISRTESINYRHFRSLKANTNGTTDHGIMGLNDANFDESTEAGKRFIASFFRFDSEYDTVAFEKTNELHILKVCIAYLKDLIRLTGSFRDAGICYNGGYARWLSRRAPQPAIEYGKKVAAIASAYREYELPVQPLSMMREFFNTVNYLSTIERHILTTQFMPSFPKRLYDCTIQILTGLWESLDMYFDKKRLLVIFCLVEPEKLPLKSLGMFDTSGSFITLPSII